MGLPPTSEVSEVERGEEVRMKKKLPIADVTDPRPSATFPKLRVWRDQKMLWVYRRGRLEMNTPSPRAPGSS